MATVAPQDRECTKAWYVFLKACKNAECVDQSSVLSLSYNIHNKPSGTLFYA